MAQGYEKFSILSNNKITTKGAPEGGKETATKRSKLKHKFWPENVQTQNHSLKSSEK